MMIATGGLLRINARRQEDKNKPPKHHRKHKKKRRSEVVVVKGKLKLCSLSGVFALLGIMVLMVGGAMASLGYWPKDAAFTSINTTITTVTTNTTSINTTRSINTTTSIITTTSTNPEGETGDIFHFNKTDNFNNTKRGFLEQFLERYLCDQRLKVVGPLVMGAGLFLFICANAVLHESRDRHTKVINLRDIYSTTIDLHRQQRRTANGSLTNHASKDEGEGEEGGKPPGAGPLSPGGSARAPGVFSIYTPLRSSPRSPLCSSPPCPLPLYAIDPYHDPFGPKTDPKHDPVDPVDTNINPIDVNLKHDPIDTNINPIDVNLKHDPIDPKTDPKRDPVEPKHDPIDPKHDPMKPDPDPKYDPIDPKHDPMKPDPDPKHDPIDPKHDPIDPKHGPIAPKHGPMKPDPDPKHDPGEPDPSVSSQTALPVHRGR